MNEPAFSYFIFNKMSVAAAIFFFPNSAPVSLHKPPKVQVPPEGVIPFLHVLQWGSKGEAVSCLGSDATGICVSQDGEAVVGI